MTWGSEWKWYVLAGLEPSWDSDVHVAFVQSDIFGGSPLARRQGLATLFELTLFEYLDKGVLRRGVGWQIDQDGAFPLLGYLRCFVYKRWLHLPLWELAITSSFAVRSLWCLMQMWAVQPQQRCEKYRPYQSRVMLSPGATLMVCLTAMSPMTLHRKSMELRSLTGELAYPCGGGPL